MTPTARREDVLALPAPYRRFWSEARAFLSPDAMACDPVRTLAWGTDASFYRLVPKIVAKVLSFSRPQRGHCGLGMGGFTHTFEATEGSNAVTRLRPESDPGRGGSQLHHGKPCLDAASVLRDSACGGVAGEAPTASPAEGGEGPLETDELAER